MAQNCASAFPRIPGCLRRKIAGTKPEALGKKQGCEKKQGCGKKTGVWNRNPRIWMAGAGAKNLLDGVAGA